jgi:hypothetical protein
VAGSVRVRPVAVPSGVVRNPARRAGTRRPCRPAPGTRPPPARSPCRAGEVGAVQGGERGGRGLGEHQRHHVARPGARRGDRRRARRGEDGVRRTGRDAAAQPERRRRGRAVAGARAVRAVGRSSAYEKWCSHPGE